MPGNILLLHVLVCALKHSMTCKAFPLAVCQQTLGVGGDTWMPTWGNYSQTVNQSWWRVELIQTHNAQGCCPRTTAEQGNPSQRPVGGSALGLCRFCLWLDLSSILLDLTLYTYTSSMIPSAWHVSVYCCSSYYSFPL